MCRLLTWVAREPCTVADALGDANLESFTQLSRQHADGWGMAWFPAADASADDAPSVERSVRCAADDTRFDDLMHSARGDAGFVHLRWATPGLPIVATNTHPFVSGSLAFAHNGAIHPQDRLDDILPAGWRSEMRGTTDSERYFLAIAARLAAGASVLEAVAEVVEQTFTRFEPTSLNAMLLAPDAVYVISAYDPSRVPPVGASSEAAGSSTELDTVFYHLHLRRREDSVVVASSGFQQRAEDGWEPLDNNALLRIERGTLAVAVESLPQSAATRAR